MRIIEADDAHLLEKDTGTFIEDLIPISDLTSRAKDIAENKTRKVAIRMLRNMVNLLDRKNRVEMQTIIYYIYYCLSKNVLVLDTHFDTLEKVKNITSKLCEYTRIRNLLEQTSI